MVPGLTLPVLLQALAIAAAFVIWPNVSRLSGMSGAWSNAVILVGSTLSGVAFALPSMHQQGLPTLKGAAIVMLAGVVNGAAVYYYSMKATDPAVSINTLVMVVTLGMFILAPLVGWGFGHGGLSGKQWLGLALGVGSILLLK